MTLPARLAPSGAVVLWILAACATSPGGTAGAPPRASGCPVEDPWLPLQISPRPLGVPPSGMDTLRIRQFQGPFGDKLLPECRPVWTLSPDAPAHVDPTSGVLAIRPNAAHGTAFTVYADLGDRAIEARMLVLDPRRNPVAGRWSQVSGTPCGSSEERPAGDDAVRELEFRADSTFRVTWRPFETYVDYWGTYQYTDGRLRMEPTGGNYVPPSADLEGQAMLDGSGHLVLSDLSLGTPSTGGARFCRAIFRR